MAIYINSAESISPQDTFLQQKMPSKLTVYEGMMKAILPDFKQYYAPNQSLRMNTLSKVGNVCAQACIKNAGIEKPDAILISTSLGCVEDTEKFLNDMLKDDEEYLTPTTFVQKIAIDDQFHSHNLVYSHKTVSFESALLDATLLFEEGKVNNVLIGGIDEITPENYGLQNNIDRWKKEKHTNLDIIKSASKGTVAGEAGTFFVLSNQLSENSLAQVMGVDFFPQSNSQDEVNTRLRQFLEKNNINHKKIDIILTGWNGDKEQDDFTRQVLAISYSDTPHYCYKPMCGQFDTASAFGMWVATKMIATQTFPDYLRLSDKPRKAELILIYHHDNKSNHSFMLLQKIKR